MKRILSCWVFIAACTFDAPSPGTGGDDDTTTPPGDAGGDSCDGVPVTGTCVSGSELARCVDGVVEHETCATGCVANDGGASCVVLDCGTVGPLGRCAGDQLARCDGAASVTDCAASNQICGYVDDTTGYGCIDPATAGAHRIAGVVRWEDRPLSPGMLGAPVAMPAHGTMVAVLDDATDATLATVSAADDGSYVAHYDATGSVRVVAYSRVRATARPARVRDASGYLHAVGSLPFAAGTTTPVDVIVTADSPAGGAWNALDNAVTAMDWLRARGHTTIAPVILYWERGSATGSYYQGGDNSLHLDGDDGFDDVVALHELGHYMQDEYSASDNPGGAHDGSPADPRLAWGEGGATWFAIAIRGVPYYIDYSAGGGWYVELEDRIHAANPTGSLSQPISEWMVAELLNDIGDPSTTDPVDGEQADVFGVLDTYLVSPQMVPRGVSGVDLVEFLDGYFKQQGASGCGPMRTLVRDQYGFPYDFPACP